ncbi:site-2 protease family protein, partial [Staphylococcus aureus]|uniref:site-2 protease family protein n=1 Tax=Staphylococcus aureus TaxID=1280 RepID=UPI00159F0E98
LASIITGGFSFDMLIGPVGIYHNVDSVVKAGIISSIGFTELLSVYLGITNFIPIPPLHRGPISFVTHYATFSTPFNIKAETTLIAIGAICMGGIMILVTWNDIRRYCL